MQEGLDGLTYVAVRRLSVVCWFIDTRCKERQEEEGGITVDKGEHEVLSYHAVLILSVRPIGTSTGTDQTRYPWHDYHT